MAGTLERVRRVQGHNLGLVPEVLPADGKVEVSLLGTRDMEFIPRDTVIDLDHKGFIQTRLKEGAYAQAHETSARREAFLQP